jgi:hypothetical protein
MMGITGFFVVGPVNVFADLAYWWLGDLPDLELRDGLSWGTSVATRLRSDRTYVMITLQGSQPTLRDTAAPLTLGAGVSHQIGSAWRGSASVLKGLRESSADLALTLAWSRSLGTAP